MRTSRRSIFAAIIAALLLSASLPLLAHAATPNPIRVGVMSGEDEDLWAEVVKQARIRGLNVKVVPFNDYTQPNEALEHGDLDANAFQHKPYLDNQIKTRGYHIAIAGYTAIWPIGLYSKKYRSVAALPDGAKIGVPNDPSNEGRALVLLQHLGLVTLRPAAGIVATAIDVVDSPKHIVIEELDAGIVGRSIGDLAAGVVNTDWAAKSKLTTSDRIATESTKNNPYRNFIAVRTDQAADPWVRTLVASYQNPTIRKALKTVYKGTAVAGW